jgi:hypothetical protein
MHRQLVCNNPLRERAWKITAGLAHPKIKDVLRSYYYGIPSPKQRNRAVRVAQSPVPSRLRDIRARPVSVVSERPVEEGPGGRASATQRRTR